MHPSGEHFCFSWNSLLNPFSVWGVHCAFLWAAFLLISEFPVFLLSSDLAFDGAHGDQSFYKEERGHWQSAGREHVSLPVPVIHSLRNGS